MFSAKLERRRRIQRLAILTATTLLVVGIAMIAIWAVQAFEMLGVAGADRGPVVLGVLIAVGALLLLCIVAYVAVRMYGRVTSR